MSKENVTKPTNPKMEKLKCTDCKMVFTKTEDDAANTKCGNCGGTNIVSKGMWQLDAKKGYVQVEKK